MLRIRAGGLFLVLALPVLIWFSWSQLGGQSSRIALEQYKEWSSQRMSGLAALSEFYLKNKRPAGAGDVTLPAVPPKSGIKSWLIRADTTLEINLDAKIEGLQVKLLLVPIVRSPNGIHYDCLSETGQIHVREFCNADTLRSSADVPAQLAENERVISSFPAIVTASGDSLAPGASIGSVVVVAAEPEDLNNCGYQCVKPENCMSSRPLACGKTIIDGNTRWLEIASSGPAVKAGDFATRTAADQACEQALGAGYKVQTAGSLSGRIKLGGSAQYWVHDEMRDRNNCWASDYR